MKKWADFLPALALHLPGCPTFVVEDAVRSAAIEFCERTRIWKSRTVTLATTVAGQTDYFVESNPLDAGLCHLHAAWVGQDEVSVGRPGSDLDYYPGQTDTDYTLEIVGRASIRLSPAPLSAGQVIVATVSYAPTDVAYGLSEAIYLRWHEAIERKAMHDLMIQVDKPWSNPGMAVFNRDRWERLKFEAANEVGPVRKTSLRVTPY